MSRLLGGGGPPNGPLAGASYLYGGAPLNLAASASNHIPLQGIVQNADGAQSVSYDATAFSGAGGARLLLPGAYELSMLLSLDGAGTGTVTVALDADPFNGFSDISSGVFLAPVVGGAPKTVPILFFTGTGTPLDVLGILATNSSDAVADFNIMSFRVRRVGGV